MSKADGQKIVIQFTEEITNRIDAISLPDFPIISGYTTQTSYGSLSTLSIPEQALPEDLLLMFWAKDDDPIESVPSGWELLATGYDTYQRLSVYSKVYKGEDKEFTVTHASEETTAIVVSIPLAGEVVLSAIAEATTTNPTPPTLESGFEANTPTLWIAFTGCDYRDVTGFPSNFPGNNIASNYTNGVGVGIASLTSTNSSEAPGSFTISSSDQSGAGVLALRFKSLDDIFASQMKAGWSLEGQQYQYVYGPLLDKVYTIESVEFHQDYDDYKHILITTNEQDRFNNVEGNLTISYDQTKGNLMGRGGAVESFSQELTPQDLVPKPNPGIAEHLELYVAVTVDFIKITYLHGYDEEIVTVGITGLAEFIDIDTLNP
ncbi:hypothetical protein [Dehalococcoides sp.]|uniref:hypothetical protein n=1 Tax=unclassified Dehalococcoides TaxID=237581 RepID=UPI002ACB12CD|nr:hypothetical protein [Dehalococcoides sp.]